MSSTQAVAIAAPPPAKKKQPSMLKNVSSSWAGLLANILLSFFLAPFVVRHLGDVYYGIWALLHQFTGYLWLFDFGVRESVIKYVAQYHAADERENLVHTVQAALTIYTAIGAAALLAAGGMALALPYFFNIPEAAIPAARVTMIVTGATVAQGFVFNVFIGVLMGLQRYYLVTRMSVVFAVIRSALVVAVLSAGYGVIAFALVQLAVSLAMSVRVYRLATIHLPYLSLRFAKPRREDVDRIVGYGKYVLVTNIGEKVVYAADSLVIGVFLPIASLTYYAVAGNLVSYLKSFIATMAVALNPRSSALQAAGDVDNLRKLFMTSAKAAVLVGLPVCVGFVVLGERFVTIWMGPAFGPIAGSVLAALGFAHMAGLPYFAITGVLYGLGKHRITATARIFEGVANVVLSVILVQKWGLIGVAVGTLIPQVIVAIAILPAVIPRLMSIGLVEYYVSTYAKPLAASVPFWLVCYFIDRTVQPAHLVSFMASVGAGLPFYALPCWLIALSSDERQMVLARVRSLVKKGL